MDWGKFVAALVTILTALLDKLALFSAGRMSTNLEVIRNDLKKLEDAGREASRVELMSPADVMRDLQRRGMRRLPDEPSKH